MGPLHAAAIQTTTTVLHRSSNTLFWATQVTEGCSERRLHANWQFNIVAALLDALMSSSLCPVELKRNEKIWIRSKEKCEFASWFKTFPHLPWDASERRQLRWGSCSCYSPKCGPTTVRLRQFSCSPVSLLIPVSSEPLLSKHAQQTDRHHQLGNIYKSPWVCKKLL